MTRAMEYNEDELARITSLQFATVIFSGLGDWAVPWRRHGLAAAVDDSAAVPEWVAQPPDCDPTQQPAWSDWHVRYRCEWGLNAADVAVIDTGLRRVRTWQRIGLAVGGALGLAIAAFTMWRKPPITSSSTSSSSSSSVGALLSNTSGAEAVSWRPSHWQWPHYALLSLATSGSASLFRRLATIAAKFAFAQDVWNLPPAVHVSSLAYEMYVRRHSHGRVVYPRLVRQRHPSEAHGGLEVIPDWVRRPWGGDAGEDWPTRLLTEWGMTVDDERVFDGDWWGLTRPVCCLVAGLSLSLIGAMVGIAAASIVQSRSIYSPPRYCRLALLPTYHRCRFLRRAGRTLRSGVVDEVQPASAGHSASQSRPSQQSPAPPHPLRAAHVAGPSGQRRLDTGVGQSAATVPQLGVAAVGEPAAQ